MRACGQPSAERRAAGFMGAYPLALRGALENGRFKDGFWTAESVRERAWVRELVKAHTKRKLEE